MTPLDKHSLAEDVQGMTLGVFLCALGLTFLTHLGLITGQTAGVAVIIAYLSGWSFGPVFFVINLPFYMLAWRRLGPAFTIKSLISVTALSVLTEIIPQNLVFATLSPALGAIAFGSLTGLGLLALFRHNGSLGGLGVVALLVQDTTRFKAGYVQLAVDAVIFALALLLFPATVVMWSLLGAVVLNLIITFNHRRDRYIAT
ncbi:YitT family protein [Loktanella sp. TSTF-M6]|uniref:YitT family protein n=1 Tax=Loktanella gaetbuli TaxID=2881335 RepID=A0ABS8BQ93_9RHOB|nr:YitT family protein [Loktanella gaetbuli]MCB5197716.1 YitT family protein [Loktanella gaetbuli]